MICNKCGAKNSDTRKKCFNCGNILENTEINNKGGAYTVEAEAGKRDNKPASFDVPEYDEYAEYDKADKSNRKKHEAYGEYDETDKYDGAEEYGGNNPAAEESENYYDDGASSGDDGAYEKPKKKKSNGLGLTIAIWALGVIFVSVLVIVGIMVYMYFTSDDNVSVAPTQSSITNINVQTPTVTKEKDDEGNEYLHAIFYGEPGDRLYLACNNSSTTFIESSLEMNLYLKDLFSSEYEFKESAILANMNAYIVRNNTKYACNVPAYSLEVPEAEMELISPSVTNQKVYSDKYAVKMWTTTDSKVTLNNTDITSYMNGLGNINYSLDVSEGTNTTYQLEVVQPYHTPKSVIFILSRDTLPVTLTIATSNASIISDSSITISGSTEANVEITSNLPIIDKQINTLYNTYTAVLDLSAQSYGEIEATITATNEKGEASTLSHTFWYWPDETKVTTSSSKLTTAALTDCVNHKGTNYVITEATAVKTVSSKLFEATVSVNGIDYGILVSNEYTKSANVSVGSKYKIFACCEGYEQDGKPVFRGWYIYKA